MRVHFKRANGAKVTLDDVDVVAHTVRETRERLATAMASMGTGEDGGGGGGGCLLYTSPSPRDGLLSRMPSSA